MRQFISIPAAALFALAGCAATGPHDPAKLNQTVSLVNSLSWDNALTGRRDGMRTAWSLVGTRAHTEHFPLAQVKRCDAAGACSWGVLNASRVIGTPEYLPNGIALDVTFMLDVDRGHDVVRNGEKMGMSIPADVAALSAKRKVQRKMVLEYGKVQRIEFDFGIGYDICAQRLDAQRKPIDNCAIPFT